MQANAPQEPSSSSSKYSTRVNPRKKKKTSCPSKISKAYNSVIIHWKTNAVPI